MIYGKLNKKDTHYAVDVIQIVFHISWLEEAFERTFFQQIFIHRMLQQTVKCEMRLHSIIKKFGYSAFSIFC